ncbi:hybrid sensor histidine kinase/response regulator transcription factor [Paenibacillus sp. V4I5]|uniref:helix-turn-helix transcriptional regulator n=1 Tax=Paenibacillus sp. V4I5 TaxID=3042306 RepID=UPI0027918370|nr:hybrid sensor histidine kinase/response regulator transcription factor [Paenibacillus sp. V4I5]MDQ0920445.1 DNA-binding NarL/FixJ family response regulator/signal transduction histidine kinase [Paenibacillus sp. V4I5]
MRGLIARWEWYDWFMIALRICWCISIIALLWEVEGQWSFPFWIKMVIAFIVISVPFLVMRINQHLYVACELLLPGVILFLLNKSNPDTHLYLLPISFMIGYNSPGYAFMWLAPLTAFAFPAWLGWHMNYSWDTIVFGIIFNYCVSYGLGYAFRLLITSTKQSKIIEEQNRMLEQNIKQIEKMTILEERNRLSREMHDTIGHMLTSLIMGMESLRASMAHGTEKSKLETLLSLTRAGFEDIRRHIHDIQTEQTDLPLFVLLDDIAKAFTQQTAVKIELKQSGDPIPVPRQGRFTLMRCLQETLTNSVRHGQADRITVMLRFEKDRIALQIRDNGTGREALQPGFGITGMRERLEALNGSLHLESDPRNGTIVTCSLPYQSPETKQVIHVVIVDDQPIVLEGLKTLLENEDGIHVAATAGNGLEAIRVCERTNPDLVLMDMQMPVMDGISALQTIKQAYPGIKVLMMSTFEELDQALTALKNGADGYCLKSAQLQELIETVRLVHSGGTAINREITAKMLERFDRVSEVSESAAVDRFLYGLTKREMEILQYLDSGMRYKTLAAKLFLSEGTVRNYISTIYGKLGVSNREEAVEKARAEGLLIG